MKDWLEETDAEASAAQLAMAEGSRLHMQLFNKCSRSSVDFLTERIEPASKRACDCVGMKTHLLWGKPSPSCALFPHGLLAQKHSNKNRQLT